MLWLRRTELVIIKLRYHIAAVLLSLNRNRISPKKNAFISLFYAVRSQGDLSLVNNEGTHTYYNPLIELINYNVECEHVSSVFISFHFIPCFFALDRYDHFIQKPVIFCIDLCVVTPCACLHDFVVPDLLIYFIEIYVLLLISQILAAFILLLHINCHQIIFL